MTTILLLWVGRYWQVDAFGLYEDDHWRITATLHNTSAQLLDRLEFIATGNPFARIGHDLLIFSLAAIGWRLGELPGMHLLGSAILALNAALFFLLLRRVDLHPAVALSGTLAFCLFPVDVSQVLLTHSLGAQPALTLLLLAGLAYHAGGRWRAASYCIAPLTLSVYESFFPLFIGMPWLDRRLRGKRLLRSWLFHAAISAAIFAAFALLRLARGDNRTSQAAQMEDLVSRVWFNLIHGPWVCVRLFFERPIEAAGDLPARALFFALAFVLAAGALIFLAHTVSWERRGEGGADQESGERLAGLSHLRLGFAGAGFLALAYPLVFELPVYIAAGRTSRSHMAAVVGMGLLFAALSGSAMRRTAAMRLSFGPPLLLAAFVGLLVLAGFRVQDDYVEKWRFQQAFMTDVVRQTPDFTDGSLILVDRSTLEYKPGLDAWSWEIYHLLPAMYRFPREWKVQPRIFWLDKGWRENAAASGDLFDGVFLVVISREQLERHRGRDLIVFEPDGGRMRRTSEPLIAGRYTFSPKPPPRASAPTAFSPGPLYRWMVRETETRGVRYTRLAH